MNHVVEIGEQDDWHLFEIFFEDINDAFAAIATYGPDIVVQQPLELKQLLIENFKKLSENHV
jgi:predicted DNA-binding transcriptional regulator YafY